MNTNVKLVLGGIAGVLSAVGLAAALLAWTSAPAPITTPTEPIATPPIQPSLTRTHQPAIETPRVAEPALVEESFEPVLSNGDVRVRRLIVATGIERHEPTGASDSFELGAQPRIYAFVDAVNETDEEAELTVTFEPARGESAGHVELEIPANVSRFRTWAYTRHVYTEGRWEVVVRDGNRVIARRPFEVTR